MERKKYRPNADTGDEKQPTSYQRKKKKKRKSCEYRCMQNTKQPNESHEVLVKVLSDWGHKNLGIVSKIP